MKAILVIDEMPNCCTACPFFEFINDYEDDCRTRCNVKFGRINEYGTDVRPKWCPFKTMPMKREPKEEWLNEYHRDEFADGWNACLEELERD